MYYSYIPGIFFLKQSMLNIQKHLMVTQKWPTLLVYRNSLIVVDTC